jgi:hypothetical protein
MEIPMNAIERLRHDFEQRPPDKQEEVLDFVAYLSSRYRAGMGQGPSPMQHVSRLKDSPNLNEDPVHIQRSLRDDWDSDS